MVQDKVRLLATIKHNADVHAIEIDQRLVPVLEKLKKQHTHFSYTLSDVLEVELSEILGASPVSVVGIALAKYPRHYFKLVEYRSRAKQMVFLLQKKWLKELQHQLEQRLMDA